VSVSGKGVSREALIIVVSIYKYFAPKWTGALTVPRLRVTQVASAVLNDPFEGRFVLEPSDSDREAAEADGYRGEWVQVDLFLEENFHDLGILCFSRIHDSLLMWSHYAESHRGFVIGFDPEHPFFRREVLTLDTTYQAWRRCGALGFGTLRDIEYSDQRLRVRMGDDTIPGLFRKSRDWCYEKEVRTIISLRDAEAPAEPRDNVYLIEVPASAVTEVIVGAGAGLTVHGAAVSLSRDTRYSHAKFLRATLNPRTYGLDFNSLNTQGVAG